METLFLICAIVGGTVLVFQFVLSLMGMGGHGDFDLPDGSVDLGHHIPTDSGHHGHVHDAAGADHSSNWYFGIITFQTVVAAIAFFGVAGMAASSAQLDRPLALTIAVAAGAAAMLGVHSLMRWITKLRSDGTERIDGAVGLEGTVYLRIPGSNQGAGKIHMALQNRLVEYAAVTSGDPLPGGAKIVVTRVIGSDTVEVMPVTATEPAPS
jgi:hypothetical protein